MSGGKKVSWWPATPPSANRPINHMRMRDKKGYVVNEMKTHEMKTNEMQRHDYGEIIEKPRWGGIVRS